MMKPVSRRPKTVWPEVRVFHPPEAAEAVSAFLFDLGAGAVLQDRDPQNNDVWITSSGWPPGTPTESFREGLEAFLADLIDIFESPEPPTAEWREVADDDWAEKWKEGLEPLEIGATLLVKPSWRETPPGGGRTVIELDPGLAFGTGRHATTRLCLEILEEMNRSGRRPEPLLDVGTGSGILALAAAALGWTGVTAVDNDSQVLPVAARNLADNGLSNRVALAAAEPRALRGSWPLILANLTALVLIDLAPELARLAAPGATLVLSGILLDQADQVIEAFRAVGVRLKEHRRREEWACLVLTNSSGPETGEGAG